jgi:hypothetical protein
LEFVIVGGDLGFGERRGENEKAALMGPPLSEFLGVAHGSRRRTGSFQNGTSRVKKLKTYVHVIARSEATRRSGVKNKIATSLALLAMTCLASFRFVRRCPETYNEKLLKRRWN